MSNSLAATTLVPIADPMSAAIGKQMFTRPPRALCDSAVTAVSLEAGPLGNVDERADTE